MAQVKATISDVPTTGVPLSEITFHIWRGMPQRPQPVIDMFRRLGGDRQRVQNLGSQASITVCQAEYWVSSEENNYADHIASMNALKGEHVTLNYYSETFENVLIVDVQYNRKNEESLTLDSIIYYNITLLVDGPEDEESLGG